MYNNGEDEKSASERFKVFAPYHTYGPFIAMGLAVAAFWCLDVAHGVVSVFLFTPAIIMCVVGIALQDAEQFSVEMENKDSRDE